MTEPVPTTLSCPFMLFWASLEKVECYCECGIKERTTGSSERKSKPKETPFELPLIEFSISHPIDSTKDSLGEEALIRLEAISDFLKLMHSTRSLHWHDFIFEKRQPRRQTT